MRFSFEPFLCWWIFSLSISSIEVWFAYIFALARIRHIIKLMNSYNNWIGFGRENGFKTYIWISWAMNVRLLALLAGFFPSGWRFIPYTFILVFHIPSRGSNFWFIVLSNLSSIHSARIRADLIADDQIYIRSVELYCFYLIGNISNIMNALFFWFIHFHTSKCLYNEHLIATTKNEFLVIINYFQNIKLSIEYWILCPPIIIFKICNLYAKMSGATIRSKWRNIE